MLELLLAHRHHRHGAPPGTPKPAGVSPLLCRGVSSLYCSYIRKSDNRRSGKFTPLQSETVAAFNLERRIGVRYGKFTPLYRAQLLRPKRAAGLERLSGFGLTFRV